MEQLKPYHALTGAEVIELLGTSKSRGLTEKEAAHRLREQGRNEITAGKRKSLFHRFIEQFQDFMILILLAAAVISFAVSLWEGEVSLADPLMILFIVVMNAVLGLVQEAKAERSLEALRRLSSPNATVLREGKKGSISSAELVCGDIVMLSAGNYVPADLRLLEAVNLRVDEAALTGESEPVNKNPSLTAATESLVGDRRNMAFAMSTVVGGHGTGIVTATGMNTESGRIAQLIQQEEEGQTPLQSRLSRAGKFMGIAAMVICIIIFITGTLQGRPVFHMFMTAVSLAVAAIPEGLPAIVTIMLSIGVQRMARKRAVVRRLSAVETLGSATVICSDKTGTLTKNELTVTEYCTPQHGTMKITVQTNERNTLLEAAVLCNNVTAEKEGSCSGEPLELALYKAAKGCEIACERVRGQNRRISEIPFDSARKRMTTVHSRPSGGGVIVIKGAFEYLLPMCETILLNGREEPLTGRLQRMLVTETERMAKRALRVVAVIQKEIRSGTQDAALTGGKIVESGFTFLGMLGMIDPPREEAIVAVATCKTAGILPVMVTGDHAVTAEAIAEQLGIANGAPVMTGSMLQELSDDELALQIKKHRIFARVLPEHKVRIVKAFRRNGEIVAMTGDGINDAPALKAAQIGCAMGAGGTDVAKGAADMILTDDNFATIVEAVREGRSIYDNIRKSVHFLLSSNIGEIITIFVAILCGFPSPLAAVQLLWVNLVTDSLPAIALGVEPPARDIMRRPPISPKKGLFADGLGLSILLEGVMIGVLALIAYTIGGQTMTFAVLSLSQLVHAFNVRSDRSVFQSGLFSNRKMNLAFLLGTVLQVSVIMFPLLNPMFHTAPMNGANWLITGVLSLVPLVIVEIQKKINVS